MKKGDIIPIERMEVKVEWVEPDEWASQSGRTPFLQTTLLLYAKDGKKIRFAPFSATYEEVVKQ